MPSALCLLVVCGAPLATRTADLANVLRDNGLRVKVTVTQATEWVDDDAVRDASGFDCLTGYDGEQAAAQAGLGGYPDVVVARR